MHLTRAITVGMIGAIAVPYVMHSTTGVLRDALVLSRFELEGATLYWSWPIFCVITAVTWGLLKLAREA